MGKVKSLVTLAVGAGIGIGGLLGFPKMMEFYRSPRVNSSSQVINYMGIADMDSEFITGHFTSSDGQQILVNGDLSNNRAFLEIPEPIRHGKSFTFYAEDAEGHRTETREYIKIITWDEVR